MKILLCLTLVGCGGADFTAAGEAVPALTLDAQAAETSDVHVAFHPDAGSDVDSAVCIPPDKTGCQTWNPVWGLSPCDTGQQSPGYNVWYNCRTTVCPLINCVHPVPGQDPYEWCCTQ